MTNGLYIISEAKKLENELKYINVRNNIFDFYTWIFEDFAEEDEFFSEYIGELLDGIIVMSGGYNYFDEEDVVEWFDNYSKEFGIPSTLIKIKKNVKITKATWEQYQEDIYGYDEETDTLIVTKQFSPILKFSEIFTKDEYPELWI